MIDSVLKGTGNSRFLKSAVPAGTSWADALAMLQAGTFPIDFNGINTEGFQQVGTPLNKANLLKDATAAQIGLPPSTTPDGMFQALGNTGELHVWRKTEKVGSKGYYLDTVSSGQLCIVNSSAYVVTFSYSSTVSAEGVLTGTVNTVSLSGTNDQTSKLSVLRGKFCKAESNGASDSVFSGIIYIPNDATFTYQRDNGDYRSHHVNKKQTVVFTDAPTITTYPVSTNPNAWQEGDDAKAAGYVVGEVVTGQFKMSERYPIDGYYYKYASSISVADNGTISLDNSSQISFDRYNGGQSYANNCLAEIAGKFVYLANRNSGTSAPDSKPPFNSVPSDVVYIPSDATLTWTEGGALDGFTLSKYQPVTGYPAIPAGTTIEYLGKLGDKARVQVVSYVGTGTAGSAHPTTVTFNFVPKVVIAHCQNNAKYRFIAPYGIESTLVRNSMNDNLLAITWKNKTMSYQNNSPGLQMNSSGVTYIVVAIG